MTRPVTLSVILAATVAGLLVAIVGYGWGLSLLAVGIAAGVIGGGAGMLTAWAVTRG